MASRNTRTLAIKWLRNPRLFGPLIGVLLFGLFLFFDTYTAIPDRIELGVRDLHFSLRTLFQNRSVQDGVTIAERNHNVSADILIVAIDQDSLQDFGRWPWPRYRHADLLSAFARINDDTQRESAVFLDLFFIERSAETVTDALLTESIHENGRVFLETVLDIDEPSADAVADFALRHDALVAAGGALSNVTGDPTLLPVYRGAQAPLVPLGSAAQGYGHANFTADFDGTFRRQPLVARSLELIEVILLDDLLRFSGVDNMGEVFAWEDRFGGIIEIPQPFDEQTVADLRTTIADKGVMFGGDTTDDANFRVRRYGQRFIPSITLALAAHHLGIPLGDVHVALGRSITLSNPRRYNPETGEREPYRVLRRPERLDAEGQIIQEAIFDEPEKIEIPIDDHGQMVINFMGPRSSVAGAAGGVQTFPVRPFRGYAARVPGPVTELWPRTRAVANKIIMVGAFSSGMADDEKNTPFGLMYGVEMHANALNTILMDNFLHELPTWVDYAIVATVVVLGGFLTGSLSTVWSALVVVLFAIGFFFGSTFAFDDHALLVNYSAPTIGLLVTFVTVVAVRVMTEERDKRRIRDMFGRYVNPSVVNQILEHPPELGGIDKELTVFFSDIRGFTTLSEAMTPQELVLQLNEYLTAMTNIILEFDGTLDKYVGDEIMCFWGAPLPQQQHAIMACRCALRQMQELERLNGQWPEDRQIKIGIGINSGIMTVGNMGSLGRMNYTLMGDNVNLGARLEGTNKQYLTEIIISEYTYGLVKDQVIARELDNIRVKGKNRPVTIYELVDVVDGIAGVTETQNTVSQP